MILPDTPLEHINHSLGVAKSRAGEQDTDPVIKQCLETAFAIGDGLEKYLDNINNNEHPLLQKIRDFTLETDWLSLYRKGKTKFKLTPEMIVDQTEARFLSFLQQSISAKNILEIGMFTGYTTSTFALDTSEDVSITAIEKEPYLASMVSELLSKYGLNNKVSIDVSDALAALQSCTKQFDFIFIDADKTNYLSYYEHILDNELLSPHGILCIDNTLMKGSVYCSKVEHPDSNVIENFNKKVQSDERIEQILLPIRDGITLVRWRNKYKERQ